MEFPILMYRCPGEHQCQGGTFSHVGTNDQDEFDKNIAAGWHPTMPEAMAARDDRRTGQVVTKTYADGTQVTGTAPLPEKSPDQQDAEAAPTRVELEQKAAELGIAFNPNIGDAKLAQRIAEYLKD